MRLELSAPHSVPFAELLEDYLASTAESAVPRLRHTRPGQLSHVSDHG
ncbi:hypothetical protein [Streptomyces sp. HUAS TT20]|nr:hypothetical protein [Streptomyces sp. HUAS 15-9]UXY28973.1 hypothetical protein N8I87_22070 [Streptomyces sp. HUAS 15-9]